MPSPIGLAWPLHEAKARFSELFRRVMTEGPQRIVKKGAGAVVIIPEEQFEQLSQRQQQPGSLVEFFRSAPTGGSVLDLSRSHDTTRDIDW